MSAKKKTPTLRGVVVGNCPCAWEHVRDNTMCHVVNGVRLKMNPSTGGPVRMIVTYRGAEAVSVRYELVGGEGK